MTASKPFPRLTPRSFSSTSPCPQWTAGRRSSRCDPIQTQPTFPSPPSPPTIRSTWPKMPLKLALMATSPNRLTPTLSLIASEKFSAYPPDTHYTCHRSIPTKKSDRLCERSNCTSSGWGTWIRTTTGGVRVHSSAVKLSPRAPRILPCTPALDKPYSAISTSPQLAAVKSRGSSCTVHSLTTLQ